MATLGIELLALDVGWVEVELHRQSAMLQQHGFVHAAVIAAAMDSACGFCALTDRPAGWGALTMTYTVTLVRPAADDRFRVRAEITGHRGVVCLTAAETFTADSDRLVAALSASVCCLAPTTGPTPARR